MDTSLTISEIKARLGKVIPQYRPNLRPLHDLRLLQDYLKNNETSAQLTYPLLQIVLPRLKCNTIYRLYLFSSIVRQFIDNREFWIDLIQRDFGILPNTLTLNKIDPKLYYLQKARFPIAAKLYRSVEHQVGLYRLFSDTTRIYHDRMVIDVVGEIVATSSNKIFYKTILLGTIPTGEQVRQLIPVVPPLKDLETHPVAFWNKTAKYQRVVVDVLTYSGRYFRFLVDSNNCTNDSFSGWSDDLIMNRIELDPLPGIVSITYPIYSEYLTTTMIDEEELPVGGWQKQNLLPLDRRPLRDHNIVLMLDREGRVFRYPPASAKPFLQPILFARTAPIISILSSHVLSAAGEIFLVDRPTNTYHESISDIRSINELGMIDVHGNVQILDKYSSGNVKMPLTAESLHNQEPLIEYDGYRGLNYKLELKVISETGKLFAPPMEYVFAFGSSIRKLD